MKAVLISIPPKGCAKIANGEKTIEVRKSFPEDHAWIGITHIYCCKNRKSFSRIPVQYQPIMEKFLGKVIGEFVCDKIEFIVHSPRIFDEHDAFYKALEMACLSVDEFDSYATPYPEMLKNYGTYATQYHADCFRAYGWHISDLKIYDKPKELEEFFYGRKYTTLQDFITHNSDRVTRPPAAWYYVQELEEER